jgi:quaternary ammonium compound-resistance protein SugE
MGWLFLLIAGACEVAFTTCLKYAAGFTRPGPSAAFLVAAAASFLFLNQAIRTIPLGTAYAVWTGIGAVGTAIIGIALFSEPATLFRILFLILIVVGIVGLKIVSAN